MSVSAGTVIALISSLIAAGAGGAKSAKEKKYRDKVAAAEEEKTKKQESSNMQKALARALGVKAMPYESTRVDIPEQPSYAAEDIIGGLGRAGAQFGASAAAKKRYPERY